MNSKAISKIQSIILIAVIVVGVVAGAAAYVLLGGQTQSSETIKIGILADIDGINGKDILQGAKLAAEQLNADGGILGRQIEVIGEDNDHEQGIDMVVISNALTRLITHHKVDFILGQAGGQSALTCQDISSEHKKIYFSAIGNIEEVTQRVLDDYDKYKYYFRFGLNSTASTIGYSSSIDCLRENTGFNKVGYLGVDRGWTKGLMDDMDIILPEVYGFDLVYKGRFPLGTFDFSSYFAAAEAAGVEILVPLIGLDSAIPFVKEYYDRQSPMVVYSGVLLSVTSSEGWEWTDGKCEHIAVKGYPTVAGFPLTSKTLTFREAYINRWGEPPSNPSTSGYDIVRFILSDAIKRAGSIETDAVIEALEETRIETSSVQDFVFTDSHDTMVSENLNDPEAIHMLTMLFQWQNGVQVPIYPKEIMEEAGATYTFPDWPGPWD